MEVRYPVNPNLGTVAVSIMNTFTQCGPMFSDHERFGHPDVTYKIVHSPEYIPYDPETCETDYFVFYGATTGHPPFILEYHQNLIERGYVDRGFYGEFDSTDPGLIYVHVFSREWE